MARATGPGALSNISPHVDIDATGLTRALQTGEFAERVQKDFSGGVRSGLNGTPTFFINGQRHDADFELETLARATAKLCGDECLPQSLNSAGGS